MFELIRFWREAGKAQRVARALHRAAEAWAETFVLLASGGSLSLREALSRESVAFGLALLRQRLGNAEGAAEFVDAVQKECRILHSNPDMSSRFSNEYALVTRTSSGKNFQFTPEMFKEFCELTGLGTDTLVGDGPNLASIVFYMVVHGHVFAASTAPIEKRLQLIRAVRECRLYLDETIQRTLRGDVEVEKTSRPPLSQTQSLPKLPQRRLLGS